MLLQTYRSEVIFSSAELSGVYHGDSIGSHKNYSKISGPPTEPHFHFHKQEQI